MKTISNIQVKGETRDLEDSQVRSQLIASDDTPFRFGVTDDGQYGYILTDEDGADTVIPFKQVGTDNCRSTYTIGGLAKAIGYNLYVKDNLNNTLYSSVIDNGVMSFEIDTILGREITISTDCEELKTIEIISSDSSDNIIIPIRIYQKDYPLPDNIINITSYTGNHSYIIDETTFQVNYNQQAGFCSVYFGEFDLTNYTSLTINATKNSTGCYFYSGVGTLDQFKKTANTSDSTVFVQKYTPTTVNCSHSFNVSSLSGKYCVGFKFGNRNTGDFTITISSIILK